MTLANSEEVAFLTTSPWFKLSKQGQDHLFAKLDSYTHLGAERNYKKGSKLLTVGDVPPGLFYIKKGLVQTMVLGKNGTEKILTISQKNCFIGEEILFHNQPALYTATAITDVKAYVFEKNTFLRILKDDFDISYFIMYEMSIRVRVLANQIEDLLYRSTFEKVCRVLCYYAEMEEGKIVPVSHQNLATIVGTHRVSITNVLDQLKEKGIISCEYGKICIEDKQGLKKMALEEYNC